MPHRPFAPSFRLALIVPVILVLAGVVTAGRGTAHRLSAQNDGEDLVLVELSTVGLDRAAGAPIVLLRDPESGRILPIWIGPAEAQAIALALHGVNVPRPMTHDLMASLLSEIGARVEEVRVHDLRNGTYFATVRLHVGGDNPLRDVDSRPSDALALALRTDAPIRVARRILVEAPAFDFLAPEGPDQVVQSLGITVVTPTVPHREEFRLSDRAGVLVTNVFGRARERGLRRGDLIVAVNGTPIAEPIEFFQAIRATPVGEPVRIAYWRDGEEHHVDLPAAPPSDRPRQGRPLAA
jgi:uncharacterized protein